MTSSLTDAEYEAIMNNETKRIRDEIDWKEDEDHSPAREFRATVYSDRGWPLEVHGRFNRQAKTLNYTLVLKSSGRIYGLDLGRDHHNPDCNQVGETHLHEWSERYQDKKASVPDYVCAADVSDPVAVWKKFCANARINHEGVMKMQLELLR